MDIAESVRFFANARILHLLDAEGRRRLLDASEARSYNDGEVVVREGEPGDALYLIVSGTAAVRTEDLGGDHQVAELSDGAFFGEIAVVTDQPRSATVTARGLLSVLRIPKDAVRAVLADYPKAREAITKIGLARTEDTLEKMLQD